MLLRLRKNDEQEFKDSSYELHNDKEKDSLISIIKKKRHLMDNCFEDEEFGIEPC